MTEAKVSEAVISSLQLTYIFENIYLIILILDNLDVIQEGLTMDGSVSHDVVATGHTCSVVLNATSVFFFSVTHTQFDIRMSVVFIIF